MIRVILLLSLLVGAEKAIAGEGTSVGVILGSPNGITARHWLHETGSIAAAFGWSISGSKFQASTDYLFTKPEAFEINEERFDLFFGGGVSLRTKSGKADGEVVFGPRLPVGVSYEFTKPDIELFLQAALNVGIIPSSDLYFDANAGVRFYF